MEEQRAVHIAAPKVKAVDTTGAGDVFIGSLAVYLAKDCRSIKPCVAPTPWPLCPRHASALSLPSDSCGSGCFLGRRRPRPVNVFLDVTWTHPRTARIPSAT